MTPSSSRASGPERRGSERELDRCGEALVVLSPKHLRPLRVPFLGQSDVIPCVVRSGDGEERDGKGVKIKALEKVVYDTGLPAFVVDVVECIACSRH